MYNRIIFGSNIAAVIWLVFLCSWPIAGGRCTVQTVSSSARRQLHDVCNKAALLVKMRASTVLSILSFTALGQGIRILQGNDDGWAEMYARTFFDTLTAAGNDVILSCPAENKSGSGSKDAEPEPRKDACEYNSCPAGSGPVGSDPNNKKLNWVNAYPVTGVRYGLDTFAPQIWNGQKPELVVTGVNVGSNRYILFPSGTVGAAVYAIEQGIPAIAFSGDNGGGARSFDPSGNATTPSAKVYAELATKLVTEVVAQGTPYLPDNTFLNVNFPKLTDACNTADKFKFVLSRIAVGVFSARDAEVCGTTRLPNELEIGLRKDCIISVSVGGKDKTTADADVQAVVNDKLKNILECLPK
ncbi:acid phosphatase [Pyricularia oryzae Y34]|nr:acid phosphatase [Pyricularia oryzae Y34]